MFKKKPILEYECSATEYPEMIGPSLKFIPEWYKKIHKDKNNKIFSFENGLTKNIKYCMPFFDSLTAGYTITLPYDLYVKITDSGSPYLVWQEGVTNTPFWRNEVANKNMIPIGHHAVEYVWDLSFSIKAPKGYSMLITHPLNRYELPFTTLSGIIDGGLVTSPHGKYPFYIKKDFEGIIHQGTPILQIIPFKQQFWKSKKTNGLTKIGEINNIKSLLVLSGWYKKTFWTKKKYV